jgi:hypothetical protein
MNPPVPPLPPSDPLAPGPLTPAAPLAPLPGLQGEVARVDAQVNQLVVELNAAIAEADRFIADLEHNGG